MKLATVAHGGRTTAAVLDGDHWRALPPTTSPYC